jgi:hypothetical protein
VGLWLLQADNNLNNPQQGEETAYYIQTCSVNYHNLLLTTHDSNIVYELKKAYNDLICKKGKAVNSKRKPYLERL